MITGIAFSLKLVDRTGITFSLKLVGITGITFSLKFIMKAKEFFFFFCTNEPNRTFYIGFVITQPTAEVQADYAVGALRDLNTFPLALTPPGVQI